MPRIFNSYPTSTNADDNYIVNQSSCIKAIRDFDKNMLDLGLVRSSDLNQLDVENIPFITLDRMAESLVEYRYLPLIYCMTDDMQSEFPIYIKITFMFVNTYNNTNLGVTYRTDYYSSHVFTSVVEISNETDGNGNMDNSKKIEARQLNISMANYAYSLTTSVIPPNIRTNNKSYKSNFTYNRDSGYLRVMLCPGYMCGNVSTNSGLTPNSFLSYSNSDYMLTCVLNFVIKRLSDGSILFISQPFRPNITSTSTATGFETNANRNLIMFFNSGAVYYDDTSHSSLNSIFNQHLYNNNGDIGVLPMPLQLFDGSYEYASEILLANKNSVGQLSSFKYNIDIGKNNIKKYELWSGNDCGSCFIDKTTYIGLLMMDENT